jgi:hypothetical protein
VFPAPSVEDEEDEVTVPELDVLVVEELLDETPPGLRVVVLVVVVVRLPGTAAGGFQKKCPAPGSEVRSRKTNGCPIASRGVRPGPPSMTGE